MKHGPLKTVFVLVLLLPDGSANVETSPQAILNSIPGFVCAQACQIRQAGFPEDLKHMQINEDSDFIDVVNDFT
jgi:hypothetical protein